jgi:hypothetical protein
MTTYDDKKCAFNGGFHMGVQQHKLFDALRKCMNTTFKICFLPIQWLINRRTRTEIVSSLIGRILGLVRKNPAHRDKRKMSKDLLLDATFGLRMKILNYEDALADFVQFFDAPSGVINGSDLRAWFPDRLFHRLSDI